MLNIMVCVTQQKTCERLIKYGYNLLQEEGESNEDEFFIIHVTHSQLNFLGNSKESIALEYLYEKALEYGANLTVERSEDVLATLCDLIKKNNISKVILGASGDSQSSNNMVKNLQDSVGNNIELIIVP